MALTLNKLSQIIKAQLAEFDFKATLVITLGKDDAHKVELNGVLKHDKHEADWSLSFEVSEGDVYDVVYSMPMFDIAGEIPVVAFEKRDRSVSFALQQITAATLALKKHQQEVASAATSGIEFNDDIKDLLDALYTDIGNELGW